MNLLAKIKKYILDNNSKLRNLSSILGVGLLFLAGLFFVLFIDLKIRNVSSYEVSSGVDNINFQVNSSTKKIRDSSDSVEMNLAEPTNTITVSTTKDGGIVIKTIKFIDVDDNEVVYDLKELSKVNGTYTLDNVALNAKELTDYFTSNNTSGLITSVSSVKNVFRNGSNYMPKDNGLLIGNNLNKGSLVISCSKNVKSITFGYQLDTETITELSYDVSVWLFFAIIFALGSGIFYFIGDSVKHKHKLTLVLKGIGIVFAFGFIAFIFVYLNNADLFNNPSALYPEFVSPTKTLMTIETYNLNKTISYIALVFDILGIVVYALNYALSIKFIEEDY